MLLEVACDGEAVACLLCVSLGDLRWVGWPFDLTFHLGTSWLRGSQSGCIRNVTAESVWNSDPESLKTGDTYTWYLIGMVQDQTAFM